MAPSANSALNREFFSFFLVHLVFSLTEDEIGGGVVEPSPLHALPISTSPDTDLHHNGHLRESPASILNPSARSKPKSWWRAQCILYGIPIDEKATVAELHASLESAVNKLGELRVVEENLEKVVESRREANERVRKADIAVRGVTPVSGKDASVKESVSGSVMDGGRGKGKKLAEKDRDVLKVVKSGPKVSKKAVKKVITKTVVSKTVKVSKKKVPKTEVAPPPPPPPEESLDLDPYEGEPMMWPMELDIDESRC